MSNGKPDPSQWKWHYSVSAGIMYGPIPVGLIVLALVVIIYLAFFKK